MKNHLFYFLFLCLGFNSCQQESSQHKAVETSNEKISSSESIKTQVQNACDQDAKIYPPSPFPTLLEKLTTSPYQYLTKSLHPIPIEESSLFIGIKRANIRLQNKNEKTLEPLQLEGLRGIQIAFIKGKLSISPNTYPRANIEEWEFQSPACVEQLLTYINDLKKRTPWDVISKSPMDYWQLENRLYFLVPGGFYMLEEAKEIQKILQGIK